MLLCRRDLQLSSHLRAAFITPPDLSTSVQTTSACDTQSYATESPAPAKPSIMQPAIAGKS